MTAQSKRLNVSASNMANADSVVGPDGEPYRARQVVFRVNQAPGQEIGGVQVSDVVESNARGYVRMPNVDVVGEMVNTISASRSYQANVEVLNTAKALMLKTLTLGQ